MSCDKAMQFHTQRRAARTVTASLERRSFTGARAAPPRPRLRARAAKLLAQASGSFHLSVCYSSAREHMPTGLDKAMQSHTQR